MISICHLSKSYQEEVLHDISLELPDCGMVVIIGKSGCGKSTLLHIIGGLDKKYQGNVYYNGEEIRKIKHYVRRYVSFLFQQFHLLSWLNGKDNINLIQIFKGKIKIREQLKEKSFVKKKLTRISGGQKQRIAFFRATLFPAPILLADEPSGSLDDKNAQQIFSMLKEISNERLVVVVTHSLILAKQYGDRLIVLEDGRVKEEIEQSPISKRTLLPITSKKTSVLALFLLVLKQMKAKWRRYAKIIIGVTLALSCILLTFTCGNSLQEEIKIQLHKILPIHNISVAGKKQALNQSQLSKLKDDEAIDFIYLELDQYEFLGISLDDDYQENSTLFISDMIKQVPKNVRYGTLPNDDHDIVLSYSTASQLSKGKDIEKLVSQVITGFYYHDGDIIKIPLTISGISEEITSLDTLYAREFANISWLSSYENLTGSIAMITLNDNIMDVSNEVERFKQQYPNFRFQQSSKPIEKRIDTIMDRVQIVLICFSILAIISSCFLIGEVLLLSVMERIKDIGIFFTLGATKLQIAVMILLEGILIVSISFLQGTLFLSHVINMINDFVASEFAINQFLSLDPFLLLLIYMVSLGLGILSSMFPAIYATRLNPIACLNR